MLEALEKARWDKLSSIASVVSAMIASLALALSIYTFYKTFEFEQNKEEADAAISWCKEFYLPSFLTLQEKVSVLSEKKFQLPRDDVSLTASKLSVNDVGNKLKEISVDETTMRDLVTDLTGILNYMNVGAAMVIRGSMDKERFVSCFKELKITYFSWLNETYIGRYVALRNGGKNAQALFPDLHQVIP